MILNLNIAGNVKSKLARWGKALIFVLTVQPSPVQSSSASTKAISKDTT
jgi:hypothetical protein